MTSREEYIDKLAAQIKEWSAKVDELESKARAAKANVKNEYGKQIGQIKDKRDTAVQKLQELKGASADAWDTLKAGSEAAWADLKNAVTAAKERFKKARANRTYMGTYGGPRWPNTIPRKRRTSFLPAVEYRYEQCFS